MPSPDRKKSKHKKKDHHRSSSKHKSKKKKQSKSRSRGKEKKKDHQKRTESPQQQVLSEKQIFDMFGNLQGFNYEFLKKIQDQFKGSKPEDSNQQTLFGMQAPGFLPYINQSIPIQLPSTGSSFKKSSRMAKNLKTIFQQRLLVPLSYDSLMVILEDPFYQEYITPDILILLKKRVIQLLKKRVSEQNSKTFLEKVIKLEDQIKAGQQEDAESVVPLNKIESVIAILDNKQNPNLDVEIKQLFGTNLKEEKKEITNLDLFEEAKVLLSSS